MKVYELHDEMVDEFFASARERYTLLIHRRNGYGCHTVDPIFQRWHFCNVFRECDPTTEWIKKNVRDVFTNDPKVVVMLTVCRLFNRIGPLEALAQNGSLFEWDSVAARDALKGIHPLVGGAYRVRTPSGMDKLTGLLNVIDGNRHMLFNQGTRIIPGTSTMQDVWTTLSMLPYLAKVVSYEVVRDLRHTNFLRDAADTRLWAPPTSGCVAGMSWMVAKNPDFFYKHDIGKKTAEAINNSMRRMIALSQHDELWPSAWPAWEMSDLVHWLTQFSAYCRAKYLGKNLHRRYPVGKVGN